MRSCESVLRWCLDRLCSDLCMFGGCAFRSLFGVLLSRYCCMIRVCMVLQSRFVAVSFLFSLFMFMFSVRLLLLNMVCFISLGGWSCCVRWCSGCDVYWALCFRRDACSL